MNSKAVAQHQRKCSPQRIDVVSDISTNHFENGNKGEMGRKDLIKGSKMIRLPPILILETWSKQNRTIPLPNSIFGYKLLSKKFSN